MKDPKRREEIVIDNRFKTFGGENFLCHDSEDERRILIFTTDRFIEELSRCNVWCIDGTFDVVSLIYTQLFTIHGLTADGYIFPLVYALLPNKRTDTYKYVYNVQNTNMIKDEAMRTSVLLEQRIAGMSAKNKRLRQRNIDARVFAVVSSFAEKNLSDYIKGIAYNMMETRKYKKSSTPVPEEIENEIHDAPTQTIPDVQIPVFDRQYSTASIRKPRKRKGVDQIQPGTSKVTLRSQKRKQEEEEVSGPSNRTRSKRLKV